jgi:hypothetical protein
VFQTAVVYVAVTLDGTAGQWIACVAGSNPESDATKADRRVSSSALDLRPHSRTRASPLRSKRSSESVQPGD